MNAPPTGRPARVEVAPGEVAVIIRRWLAGQERAERNER